MLVLTLRFDFFMVLDFRGHFRQQKLRRCLDEKASCLAASSVSNIMTHGVEFDGPAFWGLRAWVFKNIGFRISWG